MSPQMIVKIVAIAFAMCSQGKGDVDRPCIDQIMKCVQDAKVDVNSERSEEWQKVWPCLVVYKNNEQK